MTATWPATLCVVLLTSSSVASAEEPAKQIIMPIAISERGLEDQATKLNLGLVSAMEAQGYEAELTGVSFDELQTMLGCTGETSCLREFAATMKASGVIVGRLTANDDGARLTLAWVSTEEVYHDAFDVDGGDDATFADKARAFAERRPYEEESVEASPSPGDPLVAEAPARPALSLSRVRGRNWAIAAGGGAAIILGALFVRSALDRQSVIDRAPTSTVSDLEWLKGQEDTADRYSSIGVFFILTGSAALGTGAYFVVRDARSAEPPVTVEVTIPATGGAIFAVRGSL